MAFILAQVEKAWDSPLGILCSLGTSGGYAAFLAVGLAVAAAIAVGAFLFLLPCLGPPQELSTDKKTNFLIYRKIQMGAVAKSYMRKGFLIYEEMRKYLVIYEEALSHI